MDEHYGNQSLMSKWSRQMIKKLKQIREMAWSYTWIHRENAAYLTDMYEWISVISYSISFFNGIILIFPSNIVYIRILNILLSFGAGILVFYIKNKEFPQTAERHKIASSKFSNIYNNISRQLSLDVVYREEAINYHRWITLQYENLYGTAPDIDPPIIEDYIRKFAGRRKFNPIEAAEFDQTNSTSSDHPQTESTISTNDNHHDDNNDDDNNDDDHQDQNNHIDHDHQHDDDYEEEESQSDLDGTESNGDHVLEQYSANTEPYDEGKTNTFADTSISIVSFDDGRREDHVLSDADRQALDALKLSMANGSISGITPSQMEEGLATEDNIIQSTDKITIPSMPLETIIEEITNNRKKREQNVNNNTDNPNIHNPNNLNTNNPNTNNLNTNNTNNIANKNNKVVDDIYDPRRPSISLSSDSRRSSDIFNSRRSSVATQLDSRRPSIAPLYNRQSTADIQREYNNGGTGHSNNNNNNNNGTGRYSINGYLDNNYYGRPRRKNSHIAYEMSRMKHNSHEYMYSNGMDAGFMSTKCAIPEFELMQQEQIANTSRTTKGGSSSNIPRPRSNKS